MSTLAARQREFLARIEGREACEGGLEVYRRGRLATHHAALAAAYPVVRRLVGDAFFREAAARYVAVHPSRSGNLDELGARFADFLAGYPFAAGLPYLPDVARLEWALHEADLAADAPPLDFAALAAVSGSRHAALRFAFHPSVRLLASAHPMLAIWEANQAGCDGTPARDGAEWVLVARSGGSARARALGESEWRFLQWLAEGAALGEAQDRLGEAAGALIAPALQRCVGEGILCGFDCSVA